MESRWSPGGVQVDLWSPCGVHVESVGEGKVQLADAGGFRGGGSRFRACGHPLVLVLGRSPSFGRSGSFVGGRGFSLTLGVSPRCVVVLSGRVVSVSLSVVVVIVLCRRLLVG